MSIIGTAVMVENRKVTYTKRALKDALIELLDIKPLSKISITELCLKADINRSSFYKHYESTERLLLEIEDDILREGFPISPTEFTDILFKSVFYTRDMM